MFDNSEYNTQGSCIHRCILLVEITFSHLKNYIQAIKQGEGELGAISVLFSKHRHTLLTRLGQPALAGSWAWAASPGPFLGHVPRQTSSHLTAEADNHGHLTLW